MKRFVILLCLFMFISPWAFSQAIGIFDDQVSIGDDSFQGSATYANEIYDVVGSGHDLWGNADGCYYVYKVVTGPFLITTEVNWEMSGPRDGDEWKKAGLMAREGVDFPDDPSNAHATGIIIRSQGSNLEHRLEYNSRSDDVEVQEKRADETNFIQMMRIGNTFTMLRGLTDGTFRVIGSTEIPSMPEQIMVGLVVTSHNASTTERAFFSHVSLELLGAAVTLTRTIPTYKAEAGSSVSGIALNLAVEEGKTTDAVVTEKVPAGFTASNLKASIGTASVSNGVITWTIPGATGSDATLTYDIAVSKTAVGVISFSGTATSGSSVFSSGGDWELTVIPPKSNGYGIFTKSEDLFDSETVTGDAGYDPNTGTYVVIGTGNDIWGIADNFHYLYLEVSGKVSLKATCQLFVGEGHTESAKIGPMVRDEADAYSANGFSMIQSWGRDFGPQWRDYYIEDSGEDAALNVPGGTVEGRQSGTVEITRDGTNIGYYYYDAATGQRVETLIHEVGEMTDPIYIGLAVTSHNAGYYSTGVFTNVVLTIGDKPVEVADWPLY